MRRTGIFGSIAKRYCGGSHRDRRPGGDSKSVERCALGCGDRRKKLGADGALQGPDRIRRLRSRPESVGSGPDAAKSIMEDDPDPRVFLALNVNGIARARAQAKDIAGAIKARQHDPEQPNRRRRPRLGSRVTGGLGDIKGALDTAGMIRPPNMGMISNIWGQERCPADYHRDTGQRGRCGQCPGYGRAG